jgi:hypothetical protein
MLFISKSVKPLWIKILPDDIQFKANKKDDDGRR